MSRPFMMLRLQQLPQQFACRPPSAAAAAAEGALAEAAEAAGAVAVNLWLNPLVNRRRQAGIIIINPKDSIHSDGITLPGTTYWRQNKKDSVNHES